MSDDDVARAWKLMSKIGLCMLASREGEDIRARPMAAYVKPDEGLVYFLTDVRSHKDDEIRVAPRVSLAFADTSGQDYVAVTGVAEVLDDREKVRELWSTPAKAWWDNPDDPNIRVLRVTPHDAQYWDGPGAVASYIKMLAAAIGDTRPDLGDNAKVRM